MRKYRILSIILVFVLVFSFSVPVVHADPSIVVTSITVDVAGSAKVIGYISGAPAESQVTFFMNYGDEIVYIDQIATGNNGAFLFVFHIDAKYSEKTVTYAIGSDTGAKAYQAEYTMPFMPPGFKHIENNSVIYGKDAYTVDSIYFCTEYITESIVYGGNIIYFKIGDKWYNLLNSKATSSDFLVSANASADDTVKAATAPLRYYYIRGRKTQFAN